MRLALVASSDPVLKATAKRVSDPQSVRKLADDLIETMIAEGGVGLAAPQIGRSLRVFATGIKQDYQVFVNPELRDASTKEIWWEEGCLSLPRMLGNVKRPKQVTLKAQTVDGQAVTIKADELLARVLQHETDHLDGILFPDRMQDLSTLRRLTEEEWSTRFDSEHKQKFDVE